MSKHLGFPPSVVATGLVLMVLPGAGAEIFRAAQTDAAKQAEQILARLGTAPGICVLLDEAPAQLAVELARRSKLILYLQIPTHQALREARGRLDDAGLLGTRVFVEKGDWSGVHLGDNVADAVIVTPAAVSAAEAHREELLRLINPLGKVLLGDRLLTKPYPAGADDWTHPYHGPDNNPQSTDRLATGPYLTQFMSRPWYVSMPAVTVASSGRIFKAFGHIAFNKRSFPWLNTLCALNGYNGTLLWKRPLEEGFMIHRNTMVATLDVLYLAANSSCKLIDTATGELKGEIVVPERASGPSWKWMGLEDGVLYALVGRQEEPDSTVCWDRHSGGWPWRPMSKGYDAKRYAWGFGHTLLALDPKTKQVLWIHNEREPIDSRAVCMRNGRIYYYAHQKFLACLDARQGKPLWRTDDPTLLEAIGPHFRPHQQRQWWGFSSTSYAKCSDKAIYFAGPQRTRLVAVSSDDGRLLWQYPEGNFQLVLHNGALYAMGSRQHRSKKFDPLTGKVLRHLTCRRAACTRATGTVDSILCRAGRTVPSFHAGTLRLITADDHAMRIALMRPPCQDGVVIANGLLHWGPWMCDCNLSLVGNLCLGPAGDFPLQTMATEAERLESFADLADAVKPLPVAPGDWPTYRADNRRTAAGTADVPAKITLAWKYEPPAATLPTAPITVGGFVFLSGTDGVVRAMDATSGACRWKAYTAGRIYYPPAVDGGRLLVGSGDGRVYAFEAATGRPLWSFRAAPAERKIPVHGRLVSTWPVASGVLVEQGVVYAAAGIASWDGTHVYALDAKTGTIRWQNNTSGHLAAGDKVSGVSVQGHLLLYRDRLYLAGGNVVSPAVYDPDDGRCLNELPDEFVRAPRGSELFVLNGKVGVFGRLLYSPHEHGMGPFELPHLLQADSDKALIRSMGARVIRIDPASAEDKKPKALWESKLLAHVTAMALGNNAVVVAGRLPSEDDADTPYAVAALSTADGHTLWTHPLPAMPADWTVALDHAGRVVVALQDGRVFCFVPGA